MKRPILLITGLFFALPAPKAFAKETPQFVGSSARAYNRLVVTDGNIEALKERNEQQQAAMQTGISQPQLEYFAGYPVHPVMANGNYATDPAISSINLIPMSPGSSAPIAPAPTDILTHVDPALRAYDRGYANLSSEAGDGTLGLTKLNGNQVTYQLDNTFQKNPIVQLSPTTPVLNIQLSGSEEQKSKAAAYLQSIRLSMLSSLPAGQSMGDALKQIGMRVVKTLAALALGIGFFAVYKVVSTAIPMVTSERTVEVHEQEHVWDSLHIIAGTSPIKAQYLDPTSPFYGIANALMEVRAGLAEVLSDGDVNIPYLAANAANLANALAAEEAQLGAQAPTLLMMAQQDLAYAQSWLAQNASEYINF